MITDFQGVLLLELLGLQPVLKPLAKVQPIVINYTLSESYKNKLSVKTIDG